MSFTLAEGLNRALHDAMSADERVIVFGEDVGQLGGVFRITAGLQAEFGNRRCFDTPLAESGIVGTAIGFAMNGFRPVVEIQFDGFMFPAFDQIVSHVAKYHSRTDGAVRVPIVIRIPYGGGIGAVEHHSESPETYFVHTAGLRVVTPGTPEDAYGLLRAAIESDDPVIFLEPKRRYYEKSDGDLPTSATEFTKAAYRTRGETATIATYGPTVRTCIEAARVAKEEGWSLEVVDLRTLSPLDIGTVVESVERTGRLVVVHEASGTLGMGAEVAALVQERAFYSLEAPVQRVAGFDIPYPAALLEEHHLPSIDRILDAVERTLEY